MKAIVLLSAGLIGALSAVPAKAERRMGMPGSAVRRIEKPILARYLLLRAANAQTHHRHVQTRLLLAHLP